jgi:predicted dehydrogenase
MRFGLIGCGHIGQVRAQALKEAEGSELVAIADLDQERARRVAPSSATHLFTDYEKMLAVPDLEAVVVSTPPQFHESMVVAALQAGKHVLCEKPLGSTVESCRKMLETSRKTGKTLTTGFNHRYFPAVKLAKQTLDSGLIGELDHVRAFAGHTGLSEFEAPWMYDRNIMGGGALMDNGIHIIDLTRYFLGEVSEVFGIATSQVWKIDGVEDNGLALLRNPQGKCATLQATWSEWKGYRFHIEVYGDRGMVRVYYAPMMNLVITMDRPGGRRNRKYHFYPMNIIREKLHGWELTARETFKEEIADFIRLTQGKKGAIADGFAGLRAVEIANAVYTSNREKQSVTLMPPP